MFTVFGASVTQQKNGFAHKLENSIGHPVKVFGYGGMHLNNAAICFIDEIIAESPSCCFIDWFSTGYNQTNDKTERYIDTIIYKLSCIKCVPIFLFLPYKENEGKKKFYEFCKNILVDRGAVYIDIENITRNEKIDEILRDNIHTTDYGTELYCKVITDFISKRNELINIPTRINKTEFLNIKKVEVNKIYSEFLQLNGECEIIGFLLTIGPHSGMIRVSDGNFNYIENTWDRWCHYNRKHFNLAMHLSGKIRLDILQDSFDTSLCKEPIDFAIKNKKLIVHSIFFIGKNLIIENINDGRSIPTQLYFFQNKISRTKQYISNLANKSFHWTRKARR